MTIEDIEKAVAKLPPGDLARFRAWFEAFDATRFDDNIDRDANAGRLDRLAEQALDDSARVAPASYEALRKSEVLGSIAPPYPHSASRQAGYDCANTCSITALPFQ